MRVKSGYQNFFVKSDDGKSFMAELTRQREFAHFKLEDNPERAEYYAGIAKGVADVIKHIEVTCINK